MVSLEMEKEDGTSSVGQSWIRISLLMSINNGGGEMSYKSSHPLISSTLRVALL